LNTDAAEPYTIAAGDRIAQLLILPVTRARFIPVERLPGTERGSGGFGSTGYRSAGTTGSGMTESGVPA
jgi:dUTP pyrophosphatase